MNITSNYSPAFGKLKVNKSRMTDEQKQNSERVCKALKYSDDYQFFEDKPIDVFVLPASGSKSTVEIRYGDPISGIFFKKGRKLVNQKFKTKDDPIDTVAEINATLERIHSREIARPMLIEKNYLSGKTDICKLMKDYNKAICESIDGYYSIFHDRDYAERKAFKNFKEDYVSVNEDENF